LPIRSADPYGGDGKGMDGDRSQPLPLRHEPARPAEPTQSERHRAAAALLLATVFWGCGFTWAKAAGEAVHRALGLPDGSAFGPVYVLGWRFTLAALAVFLLFRDARAGWTWRGVRRVTFVGALLAVGLVVQHLGLDRTSEAVSAFLTSLTILFVPLILTLALRKPPAPVMWLGVVLATAGVWLMTGAAPTGFGVGEVLGLACALAFSLYIFAVNAASRSEHAWRLTAGQFLVVGVACFATCAVLAARDHVAAGTVARAAGSSRDVWLNVLLLTLFPTLGAFSLLNHYQPKLDPTRAALVYLIEPVVAATYAWVMAGRSLHPMTLAGAALILAANAVVEVLSARGRDAPVIEPASSPR
jgi:drug/metabolite transporter (DMT)-like permease